MKPSVLPSAHLAHPAPIDTACRARLRAAAPRDSPPVTIVEDARLLARLAPSLILEDGCAVAAGCAETAREIAGLAADPNVRPLDLLLGSAPVGCALSVRTSNGAAVRVPVIVWTGSSTQLQAVAAGGPLRLAGGCAAADRLLAFAHRALELLSRTTCAPDRFG